MFSNMLFSYIKINEKYCQVTHIMEFIVNECSESSDCDTASITPTEFEDEYSSDSYDSSFINELSSETTKTKNSETVKVRSLNS